MLVVLIVNFYPKGLTVYKYGLGCLQLVSNLKNANIKKWEYGSKVKKVCKQVRDQIVWKLVKDTAQRLL